MFRKSLRSLLVLILALALVPFQASLAATAQVPVFSDGFESGNLSAWSGKMRDGGDLAVTSAAAMVGQKGMRALMDDNHSLFVQDDTPNNLAVYNANFHFDPNSVAMANLDLLALFIAYDSGATFVPAIRVDLRFFNGAYQLRARSRNDNLTWTATAWFTITDGEHQIEVEWDGASLPGQNDGKLKFKIDGVVKADRGGIDSDTFRVDRARLGVIGVDTGTRGTVFFDQFESFTD
jgi:hypothetical protein